MDEKKDTVMMASPQNADDLEKVDSQANAQVDEIHGHLNRGLKERHVQFIAIGGTIGVGLFVGIGSALATGGPLSLFLGYLFTSMAIWTMMQGIGEMASLLPLPGMIAQSCTRFVDPALGFSVGCSGTTVPLPLPPKRPVPCFSSNSGPTSTRPPGSPSS